MDDQQSSKEVVDWGDKQSVWDDVSRRDVAINKPGQKEAHPKGIHTDKQVPTGQL